MSLAELKNDLIATVLSIDDEAQLLELKLQLSRGGATAVTLAGGVAGDGDLDRVLDYRPNGEAVTLRVALPHWEKSAEEVRGGGGAARPPRTR